MSNVLLISHLIVTIFLIAIMLTILSLNSGSNKSVFEELEGAEDSNKKELTPDLPDLKKFKSTNGVLTPPTE